MTTPCTDTAALLAHIDAVEAELIEAQTLKGEREGHATPCTYGPLCPYCEIQRRTEECATHKAEAARLTAERDQAREQAAENCRIADSNLADARFEEAEAARLRAALEAERTRLIRLLDGRTVYPGQPEHPAAAAISRIDAALKEPPR